MPAAKKGSLRRFLPYILNYKGLLALACVMGLGKFILSYGFPWLIGAALDHVVAPAPGLAADHATRVRWLWIIAAIGVVLSFLHAVSTYGRGYYTAKIGNRVIADLRQDLFDHLYQLSLHFYSKARTGSIISRLITDIQTASQIVNGGVVSVIMDVTHLALGLTLVFSLHWKLALACVSVLPFYVLTFKRFNPRVKAASQRVQSQMSKISGNAQERLAGVALVKTYAAERREQERFNADTEEHYERVLVQSNISQVISGVSEFLVHFVQVTVIGLGGWLAIQGDPAMTPGTITKFIGWLAVMYLPIRRFAEINVVYQQSMAAMERVFEVFDITPKIVDRPEAIKTGPVAGVVSFKDVWFDYTDDSDESRVNLEPERSEAARLLALEKHAAEIARRKELPPSPAAPRWVLKGLSFDVASGQRIALVGPSGSGKTTLVSLLPRLYDVTRGSILIDGVDVRDYRLKPLRRSIGIVQQDSFLFSGSVRDNIAYGKPKATDEMVIAATQAANAHEFVSRLPDGYASHLGERGVNLSGGQRQRLSIARAILKDPRILILDEATSALDSESEVLVQEALDRLMKGRTCFIIAHRLSTVRNADRIIVLDQGSVIETGRHDDLVAAGGLYSRLVAQQFGHR